MVWDSPIQGACRSRARSTLGAESAWDYGTAYERVPRMTGFAGYFFPVFLLIFLIWAGVSAFALVNRAVYDMRQRAVRAAQANLATADGQGMDAALEGLSRSSIEGMTAANDTLPQQSHA